MEKFSLKIDFMTKFYTGFTLLILSFIFYSITNYGGIRTPDGEILFSVGESLASNQSFEVYEESEWKGFGVARGVDGKLYTPYAPMESIVCAPFIKLAKYINKGGWYKSFRDIPLSHYVGDKTLLRYIYDIDTDDPEPHALRFVVSFFEIIISSLGVFFFWLIANRISSSLPAAFSVSLLYAFGTLVWPYAGTFFTEPLATLFVLISLYLLIYNDVRFGGKGERLVWQFFVAGLSLGAAFATHITAVFFFPAFLVFVGFSCFRKKKNIIEHELILLAVFILGFGIVVFLMGYYNFVRFGSFFETGRTVKQGIRTGKFLYGFFNEPWTGIYELLFGSGKGIFFYCPAVLGGILTWRWFYRKYCLLSFTLLGVIVVRFLFVASFIDWHGGFCLGPRYLLMFIPFMLMPLCVWLSEQNQTKKIAIFFICTFICIYQQIYFCIGEIFSYYHIIKLANLNRGIDIFKNNQLYVSWKISPLFHLLEGKRAPFLLQNIPVSNVTLWAIGVILSSLILGPIVFKIYNTNNTV